MRASRQKPPVTIPLLLGIEGGGTRTTGILATPDLTPVRHLVSGPGNLRLLSDTALLRLFRSFNTPASSLAAVCAGLAGCRTAADHDRVERAAAKVWPGVPCLATNDLETALAAAKPNPGTPSSPPPAARVLVLSGTGSCCFGRSISDRTQKTGGWGHLLGDAGSGYHIGLHALRTTLTSYDTTGRWPKLGSRLLRALQLNEPDELIAWAQAAPKDSVAALATEVFSAARAADPHARQVLRTAAQALAANALACVRPLAPNPKSVEFLLAGGNLTRQPAFARLFQQAIRHTRPRSKFRMLNQPGAWGAVRLAQTLLSKSQPTLRGAVSCPAQPATPHEEVIPLAALTQSPTERRNPRSMRLHLMSDAAAIRLMLSEDATIPAALLREEVSLRRALRVITTALRNDHRLFYVGAGTSGRLGVLDASECPPTFQTPPHLVQGIIAGGQRALWQAVEGAEDDADAGARALHFRGVGKGDVVLGIAASGRTPFVWGALAAARQCGARTILLCFNPALKSLGAGRPDILIAPDVGPEILTGSTRLKAGTATKLILNLLTTLAMVRLGKVVSNLMIDLNPSNVKLRDRAVRIVSELTGLDRAASIRRLEKSKWAVRKAVHGASRRS